MAPHMLPVYRQFLIPVIPIVCSLTYQVQQPVAACNYVHLLFNSAIHIYFCRIPLTLDNQCNYEMEATEHPMKVDLQTREGS